MEGIGIMELPPARMATSGDKELDEFGTWWSNVDKERKDRFFPRDSMWFDEEKKRLVWFYAFPNDVTDSGGYDVADLSGALYAAAISRDKDDIDGERVFAGIDDRTRSVMPIG